MTWNRRLGLLLVAAVVLVPLPGCGDPCDTVIIDTTMPAPRRVLRPAEALIEAVVADTDRLSEFRINVDLEVGTVLVPGESGHDLEPGPLSVTAYDYECSPRSPFLSTGGQPVLLALRWDDGDDAWTPWRVMRENQDGTITFLEYGGRLDDRIDEILRENTVEGVIEMVEKD